MFKAVISRDHGEPWGKTGMTSKKWLGVGVDYVEIDELIATQPGLLLNTLIRPGPPASGDPYPHVISWRGDLYLEDGHHRVTLAALSGESHVLARVLIV